MENIILADIIPVVVAIISSAGGILGAYLAVKKTAHEKEIRDATREQRQADMFERIEEKMERLERKVDEHNGYAEKFAENSKSLAVLAKDIEFLKNKI